MKFLTIWLPVLCFAGAVVQSLFFSSATAGKETSLDENLTVVFLLAALVVLIRFAIGNFKRLAPLDKLVLVCLVLGSIYFAGEELSWGQHILGFETPAGYAAGNHQGETNIHNSESPLLGMLFDKLPRTLMTIGVGVGGIVFPFCRPRLPAWLARYVQGKEIVLTSILAVSISVPNKIAEAVFHHQLGIDGGEMKEMYIALFILLFSIHFTRLPAALPPDDALARAGR